MGDNNTSEADGRTSPLIRRSIRESIHNFEHDSPVEVSSDDDRSVVALGSDDESSDASEVITKPKKKAVQILDINSDEDEGNDERKGESSNDDDDVPSNEVSEVALEEQVSKSLTVQLWDHQLSALIWLLWRETQKPAGGVLADDSGTGKTLTMIALIIARKNKDSTERNLEESTSTARRKQYPGGTLVVAPASLIDHWEKEVEKRCERGVLTVALYHGENREKNAERLARNDIVITSYNILSLESKKKRAKKNLLYKIHWKRVILDEAHVIRNYESKTCEAVCALDANKRWVLTRFSEMKIPEIMKFLRSSLWNVQLWKSWVDNDDAEGVESIVTFFKRVMLSRTVADLRSSEDVRHRSTL